MKLLKNEWLYVSTRRCGTNTLYALLPGERSHQYHIVPQERLAPIHWAVVRNPYDRAVSLWAHAINSNQTILRSLCKNARPSLEIFIEKALLSNITMYWDQHRWLNTGIVDKTIHLENLVEGVLEITGIPIKNFRANKSKRDKWETYMNSDTVSLINEWAKNDFQYGYTKLLPSETSDAQHD